MELDNIERAFKRFDYISKQFIYELKNEEFYYGKETRNTDKQITRFQQAEIKSNYC